MGTTQTPRTATADTEERRAESTPVVATPAVAGDDPPPAAPLSCPVPSPVLDAAAAATPEAVAAAAQGAWDLVTGWWGADEDEAAAPEEKGPLDDYVAAIDPEDQDATHAAVQDGIADWRSQLEALPPEERAAFLAETQDDVGELFAHMGTLDYDQSLALMQDLAAAGEVLGPDAIGPLVAELGGRFGEVVQAQMEAGEAMGAARFGAQFAEIIGAGDGALLATSLLTEFAASEQDEQLGWAFDLGQGVYQGMDDVRERHSEAVGDFEELEAQFSNWAANNYELYGPEGIAAAEKAFRDEHAEEYARIDEAQRDLATTLEGAAVLHGAEGTVGGMYTEDLHEVSGDLLEGAVDLSKGYVQDGDGNWVRSNLGETVFADALLRDAEGGETFLDELHELASEDGQEGLSDELKSMEEQAVFTVSQALTLDGRFEDVGLLVQGLAEHHPEFGPVAGDLVERMRDLERQAEDGSLSWEQAQEQMGEAFRESVEGTELPEAVRDRMVAMGVGVQAALGYAEHLQPEDASFTDFAQTGISGFNAATGVTGDDLVGWTGKRVGAIGSVLGLAGGLVGWAQGNTDLSDSLGTVWSGVQTADMLINGLAANTIVGKMALPVGLLIAGVDLAEAIADGDPEKIAVASLPFAGAGIGAAIGSIVPGAGTLAGATLGFAIGGLVQFIGGLFGFGQDDPEESYEEDTEVMTRAALGAVLPDGTSEETLDAMARQLSETDDNFVGVGPVIALVATEMGLTPQAFLENLAEITGAEGGEDVLEDLVKHNLLDAEIRNWDDIEDARDQRADGEPVEIPELEYSAADVASLATLFDRGFDTGDFRIDRTVTTRGGTATLHDAPDLHGNYGRDNDDDERVISVASLHDAPAVARPGDSGP